MENNTSNYAKWIPEAGGYVHNGVVVSKSPVYDTNGRTQIEVDVQNLTTPKQAGTQENQAGSGVDVNADMTQVGSLGTLNNNTAKPEFGTVSSPATQSNIAGSPVLSPIDQVNKDYEYMVATNNIKGQIDALTQLSQLTGVDYSQTIQDLWNQRSQKIQNEDSKYTQAIAQARQAGDEALAQDLALKQQAYRDSVGYFDQMGRDLQNQQDILQAEYETTYMQGINDITNGIMSQLSNLINFQYNPQTDLRLQVAQGYAVGAVKEQMNHTGMYYSSMTQSAITRAVAELVPVYEEMARDEIKENISLLQNVGNYLMNLENMQLSIWEAQINMKIKANAEKRAQINQAIENANARGYYTNEEAVLLGVPAGTESHEARTRAEDKQDEIEKEQRQLAIQKELYKYNSDLQKERTREEYALKTQYANSTGSGSSTSYATIKKVTTDEDGNETTITYQVPTSQIGGALSGTTTGVSDNLSTATKQAISGLTSTTDVDTYLNSKEFKDLSPLEKSDVVTQISYDVYKEKIKSLSEEFSEDYGKTTKAVKEAKDIIEKYVDDMTKGGVASGVIENTANELYADLFARIESANEFDYIWGDGIARTEKKKEADTTSSKAYAERAVIESMEKSNNAILQSMAKNEENTDGYNENLLNYQGIKKYGASLYFARDSILGALYRAYETGVEGANAFGNDIKNSTQYNALSGVANDYKNAFQTIGDATGINTTLGYANNLLDTAKNGVAKVATSMFNVKSAEENAKNAVDSKLSDKK